MYEGAGHAFTNKDRPDAHHAAARAEAFERTFKYFSTVLN